jgi:hypothetical protein
MIVANSVDDGHPALNRLGSRGKGVQVEACRAAVEHPGESEQHC